jgi:LuxR family quorum-sensing system transcriptional regulator SolR
MLQPLKLCPVAAGDYGFVPRVLRPLIDAAARGEDLAPVIEAVTRSLGFDSFMFGISLSLRPNADSSSFVYTTLPDEWVKVWDERAYVEIDPRVQVGMDTTLPLIWDQTTYRGRSRRLDAFLDAAMGFGVASGVSVPIRDSRSRFAVCALNSRIPVVDEARREMISQRLGDIVLLANYFYPLLVAGVLDQRIPPIAAGKPLSARERQCLEMAAHGLTTLDVAIKLGIAERTAQFHFSNILDKLGVLNRAEAIAKSINLGLITLSR